MAGRFGTVDGAGLKSACRVDIIARYINVGRWPDAPLIYAISAFERKVQFGRFGGLWKHEAPLISENCVRHRIFPELVHREKSVSHGWYQSHVADQKAMQLTAAVVCLNRHVPNSCSSVGILVNSRERIVARPEVN